MPPVTHAPSPERFAKAWSRRSAETEQRRAQPEQAKAGETSPPTDQLERASKRAALVNKLIGQQGYNTWQAMLAHHAHSD